MADERIYNNLTELIGNTPLVRLSGYMKKIGVSGEILAKLEYFNPLGSSKDRVGSKMIEDAEKSGMLDKDTVIIEPTSGNTGVGLAFTAAIKGYKLILTMPENMSAERKKLLSALGAQLVLTPAIEGMGGSILKATELAACYEKAFIPNQFGNPSNPQAHRESTGPEILRDTDGKLDCFVSGVGTGGTITGIAEVLKKHNPDIHVIAVEPSDSPVLSGGKKGAHGLMGIGAGFVPEILNRGIIDEIITISTEEAYSAARIAAKTDGVLMGISSGAALHAAAAAARRYGRTVVLLPDSGERYLSTALFE